MNCKPGDLAVIVKAKQDMRNIGKIVTVLRLAIDGEYLGPWRTRMTREDGISWVIEGVGQIFWAGDPVKQRAIPDEWLRPITPPPGTVTTEEVKTLFSPSPSMEPA
jgi:hypothetical protein